MNSGLAQPVAERAQATKPMRILHANKFLYRRGGAEGYMEDLAALQVAAGHTVDFFGMRHSENTPRFYERDFPSEIELNPPPTSGRARVGSFARMVWSRESERAMERVVDAFRPDVVHLHNIYHQLSPSILRPLKRRGIATVMTVHDYKLVCPNYQLLDHGKLCEACLGGAFYNAPLRRCKDGSLGASLAAAAEASVHRAVGAYDPVHRFICPSEFLRDKLAAGQVYPDRLRHVRHFIDLTQAEPKSVAGGSITFAGRLSHEKGIATLVEAIGRLRGSVELDIAGDGPMRQEMESLANRVAPGHVRFHGRLDKPALEQLMRGSVAVAVPSEWYENQPMVVLEALGLGVPVVGSDLGGIPELIEAGVDGLLVPAGDVNAWAAALERMAGDPATALTMGAAGRRKIATQFSAEAHIANVDAVYQEALGALVTSKGDFR